MKRFYTNVAIDGERCILLDGRPVKTAARATLALPNVAMAEAVAEEWRAQGDKIDPRTMPATGFANAAIDRVAPDAAAFAADLATYAETDLLCYRAESPEPLIDRQQASWDPILAWARTRYDIGFETVTGIMHRAQPPATIARLSEAVAAQTPFTLAALSPIVTISGSLVIALALTEQAIEPNTAFDAAHLDELWQAELWGEDTLGYETREARRHDFLAACAFLKLTRPHTSSRT